MNSPSVNDMMEAYSLDAVDFARSKFDVTLDFSSDSIREVENIAAQLHATMPKSFLAKFFQRGPSQDELDLVCKMLGGYVGEVIRRERGGDWRFNEEIAPGSLVIELRSGESSIFPPAKVHKRLTNGSEDNLWSYYQVLADETLYGDA